jgi:isoleucyl-tRNA synthetase
MVALDRWAVARAAQIQDELIKAYDRYEFHVIYQKVHNFCNVDMGSFYLDVIKDRLYTAQKDSVARRSAQSAMYYVVTALVRWLAPILSFTAEEIWRSIPGENDEASVFLSTWAEFPKVEVSKNMDQEYWSEVLEVREAVGKEIERLRVTAGVGSSLAVEVDLYCGAEICTKLRELKDELRFVLITSYARVHRETERTDNSVHYTLRNGDELWIAVKPTDHAKCVRCWHHREEVGANTEHPQLCGRCVENVAGAGESREFA